MITQGAPPGRIVPLTKVEREFKWARDHQADRGKHRRRSRGGSVVILQQSTEPLTRQNAPVADRPRRHWHDQLIAQTLMIPFVMIVLDEFGDGSPERPFTDENHPVQAGFLDRPYEPLRVRIEIRRTGRQADHLHACGGKRLAERHA